MSANDYQALPGTTWTISSVDLGDTLGVAQNDSLEITTSEITIWRQSGGSSIEVWAYPYTIGPDGLHGSTTDGRAFLIQYDQTDPSLLTCLCPDTASQRRRVRAAGLSAILGALIGAAAGVAGSHLLTGVLAGLAAALTGSLLTAATTGSLGSRYDSQGRWIAEEGETGNREIPKPGPRVVGVA
jgi:VIT1/CCC1 family predicted Fe2+/Mn2+ transporter